MLATTKKGIVVVEVEVLAPRGFGRVRMRRDPRLLGRQPDSVPHRFG
jgi:hypothetical protein